MDQSLPPASRQSPPPSSSLPHPLSPPRASSYHSTFAPPSPTNHAQANHQPGTFVQQSNPSLNLTPTTTADASPITAATTPTNPRLRSSIACARCRRSKIKCTNAGAGTTCEACAHSGRECVYPTPGTTASGSHVGKREGDVEDTVDRVKRPRVRKSEVADREGSDAQVMVTKETNGIRKIRVPSAEKDVEPQLPGEGTLDPKVLTPLVWREVFELFQMHFGTDLPFLHAPTFLPNLSEAAAGLSSENAFTSGPDRMDDEKIPGWEMLLLGILALAARFHAGLVRHHCSRTGEGGKDREDMYASEYYAIALRSLLVGGKGVYIGQPNLPKVQALLMLGLHEWGLCKGIKAWIHVGLAIRMAQAMGLQFEDDLDVEPWALSSAMRIEAHHLGIGGSTRLSNEPLDPASAEAFIDEEMRRRTFWSCFVMDRYLSSGKYRPAMLSLDDLKLQLPCGERAWVFGDRVCTSLISGTCSGTGGRAKTRARMFRRWKAGRGFGLADRPTGTDGFESMEVDREGSDGDETRIPCEYGSEEGLLSRFVRMVEIWGKIAKWSCAGGRRTEELAPWNPRSQFYQLRDSLAKLHESTPRAFRLTKANIQAHLTQQTASTFTLLHTLYSLCLVILHREFIAFVPLRCSSPSGPLEDSAYPSHPPMPTEWWSESSKQMFKAARDIMDLVNACKSRGMLVETPIMGFGLYTVAFVGVYAMNFPHMDPDGHMCGKGGELGDAAGGQRAAREALEIIGQMRSRLPMAKNWFRTIHRVHRYYERIIGDYRANTRNLGDASSHSNDVSFRHLTLREGGMGGGAEGFKLLEKTLKEFGSIEDEEIEPFLSSERDRKARNSFNGSSFGDGSALPRINSRPLESWTAINSIVNPISNSVQHSRSHQNHTSSSDQQQQHHAHHAPTPKDSPSIPPPPSLVSPGTASTSSIPSSSPYQRHASTASPYDNDSATPTPPLHTHQQYYPQNSQQPNQHYQSQSQKQPPPYTTALPSHAQPLSDRSIACSNTPSWIHSLRKPLGGDDVAAFVDGRSLEEWALLAANSGLDAWNGPSGCRAGGAGRGVAEGWLSDVWAW